MSDSLIQFRAGKKLFRTINGITKVVRAAIATICCSCTPILPVIPPICTSTNTCRTYCNPSIKQLNRSPQCPCQCSGGRAFPRVYTFSWPVSIKIGQKFQDPGDGHWYAITSGPSRLVLRGATGVEFTCPYTINGKPQAEVPIEVTTFDTDGTTVLDVQSNGLNMNLSMREADCAAGEDKKRLYVVARIDFSAGFGPWNAILLGAIVTPVGSIDRCQNHTEIPAPFPTTPPPNSPFVVTPLEPIQVNISCRDCSGNWLNFTGDPVEICSYEYDVHATIPDGPGGSDLLHVYRMWGSGTSWYGSDQFGNIGIIQATTTNPDLTVKCCPPFDPDKCGEDGAVGCWFMVLNTNTAALTFYSTGDCPIGGWTPDATNTLSADLTAYGFIEGCLGRGDCFNDNCGAGRKYAYVEFTGVGSCNCVDGPVNYQTQGGPAGGFGGFCSSSGSRQITGGGLGSYKLTIQPADPVQGIGFSYGYSGNDGPGIKFYRKQGCAETPFNPDVLINDYSSSFVGVGLWCISKVAGTHTWQLGASVGAGGDLNRACAVGAQGGAFFGETTDSCDDTGHLTFNNQRACIGSGILMFGGSATVRFSDV